MGISQQVGNWMHGNFQAVMQSVIGAAIFGLVAFLCGMCVRYVSGRRGFLAGWWWVVTYPPRAAVKVEEQNDGVLTTQVIPLRRQMNWLGRLIPAPVPPPRKVAGMPGGSGARTAPPSPPVTSGELVTDGELSAWALHEGSPWSIELTRVRHYKNKNLVKAKHWRIVREHTDRVWKTKAGHGDDATVYGYYWGIRAGAGHGTYLLRRASETRYVGQFSCYETHVEVGVESKLFTAPLEWIKVGSSDEKKLCEWLKEADPGANRGWWPWPVRRLISSKLGLPSRIPSFILNLSFGSATVDLTSAYAGEIVKRSESKG